MAGWSLSSCSSSIDVVEILRKLQSVGYCLDLSTSIPDLNQQKLTSFFNRILSVFQREIQQAQQIRPIPAMLGDGQAVDLFKLYSAVRERGGCESLSAEKGWGLVAEALGFDSRVGSSLKLIYVKYLEVLERWLEMVLAKKDNLSSAVGELRVDVNGLFQEASEPVKEEEAKVTPKKNHFLTTVRDGGRRLKLDDDEKFGVVDGGGGDDVIIIEPEVMKKGSGSSNKRKREALVGMLDWVLRVAKNPWDPIDGKILPSNDGKDKGNHLVGRIYSQALLARQAMFLKKARQMDEDISYSQKGQKMHPSIYEDHANTATSSSDKLRHSERINSMNKQSNSSSNSEASTIPQNSKGKGIATDETNTNKKKARKSNPLSDIMLRLLPKDYTYQEVPVSSHFQAKLPPYPGKSCDLKWLGTPIWLPDNQVNKQCKNYSIGKGRQDSCKCERPGSIQCIRFHVAENRFKLKRELGLAFNSWRFDCMGEEVALSWTEEEARKFKAIVRLNPLSLNKNFWDQLRLAFPTKSMKSLVSYYFNVFVVARRSYQNRLTPSSIDSDDEELEFGFLSIPFGQDAVDSHAPKSDSNLCAQNSQCFDIDD